MQNTFLLLAYYKGEMQTFKNKLRLLKLSISHAYKHSHTILKANNVIDLPIKRFLGFIGMEIKYTSLKCTK